MTDDPDKTAVGGDVERLVRAVGGPLEAVVRATIAADTTAPRQRGPAPVHLWNPPYCGDIGLEIRADGSWWYQGSVIGRPAMVALFASVLRKDEDGQTYLVTPVEKLLVRVADAPFLGVDLTAVDAAENAAETMTLTVTTNLGDRVAIGPDHPLRFEPEAGTGGLKPYVLIRGRLEARLTRAMTHELVHMALSGADAGARDNGGQSGGADTGGSPPCERKLGVWSGGLFWPLPGGSDDD
ncbi:MAG: DUF1285 domain-containing protein [Hyphomicrobiaceae bacterium]|nr:DUF1285 domain-containing protein [Hyphomicrobiaceae bacterium]